MPTMNDKVAIVTGGSSGIGHAIALGLASRGVRVLITGRRATALDGVTAGQDDIAGLVADVSDPIAAERTVATAIDRWGRLDILVNNAGAGALLPLRDVTVHHINKIFATNVTGPSLLVAAAIPHLQSTRGVIVNISSTFGHKPGAQLSHYAASKAALEHLTRCWALELAPEGIRVNAVAAGPTQSGALTGMMGLSVDQAAAVEEAERQQIPLGRRGNPDDVARWVVLLADPASEWVTGQVIAVDGGLGLT